MPLAFIFTVTDVTLSLSSIVTDQRIKSNGDSDLQCGGWLGTAFSLPSVPGYRQEPILFGVDQLLNGTFLAPSRLPWRPFLHEDTLRLHRRRCDGTLGA